MPQNNQDITNSQEFKDFCKNANLEVFNQEAMNVLLFSQTILIKDYFERIQKLEERLMEVAQNTIVPSNRDVVVRGPSLADKWK